MLGRVPAHPVLVGAFPVLLLWARNGSDVPPGDGAVVLAAVVAALLVVTVVAALLLRDTRRGALVGSAIGVVALSHGHMWGTTGDLATWVGLPVAALLVGLAVWRVRRLDAASAGRVTATANVLTAVLVAATLPGVLGSVRSAHAAEGPGPVDVRPGDGTSAPGAAADRDVVWIVPDRHGSEAGLAHTFGLDASGFTAALEERGFSVADAARSNYSKTNHSLAAALQLDYLDGLAATVPDVGQGSTAPVNALLSDHEVGRRFRAAGYHTVHLGSWWGPTARSAVADEVLTRGSGATAASEFADVFLTTTILRPLDRREEGSGLGSDLRARQRAHGEWQLEQLDALARRLVQDTDDAPQFVFVHLLLPHEPYVFDADGSLVDRATEKSRSWVDNYDRQASYLHQRLLAVLDTLSQAPDDREPIVLLQADEGPHPERAEFGDLEFRWAEATDAELLTKFSVLSALRVPGTQVELREDITSVNVARVLVNEALGTTLEELPDRSYIFPDDERYYEFIDVSARLDAAAGDD